MALVGKSLDAATTTGPGLALEFDTPKSIFSLKIMTTGSPTFNINLEGSLDGVNWDTLLAHQTTGLFPTWSPVGLSGGTPLMAIRANLTSLSGGTSPTVTAIIAAQE